MGVVDQIKHLATQEQEMSEQKQAESSQLKDLEEVEETLKQIGVNLEPRFDISLAARIGARSSHG